MSVDPVLISSCVQDASDGVTLSIKVVPGASRSKVAGVLGDRIKVSVSAAPEGGMANRAVIELFSKVLNAPRRDIEIKAGHTQPRKTVEVIGVTKGDVVERLTRYLDGA